MNLVQEQYFVVYQPDDGDKLLVSVVAGPFWVYSDASDCLHTFQKSSLKGYRYSVMSSEITLRNLS